MAAGWRSGLDHTSAVGGHGRYRSYTANCAVPLATCLWDGVAVSTIAPQSTKILRPELPDDLQVRLHNASWTGRTLAWTWRGGALRLELRTTLPGPMFASRGSSIRLCWLSGQAPPEVQLLPSGTVSKRIGQTDLNGVRALVCRCPIGPMLLVANHPFQRIVVTDHAHWHLQFVRRDVRLLVVPLLLDADMPRDAAALAPWLSLAEHPPIQAVERFRERGELLEIDCRFPGARLAPLPPSLALLGDRGRLVAAPAGRQILHTWQGPFSIVAGASWRAAIAMGWSRAGVAAGRIVPPPPLPTELTYAGDWTWDERSPMDRLLAWRTWAPLVAASPELGPQLWQRVGLPTAAELRRGIEPIREPVSGLVWGRWRQMWDDRDDVTYDCDWYNGLALSGLARAAACADPVIARRARALARASRRERDLLAAYFSVFHEWSVCGAWSTMLPTLWLADCMHNGLEGMLAEAHLRDSEGRDGGHLRYLAGRTAIALRVMVELPAWWDHLRADKRFHLDVRGMRTWRVPDADTSGAVAAQFVSILGATAKVLTPRTRNPYLCAGHNPAWNALLRDHVDRALLQLLADGWEREDPERYRDWQASYIGTDIPARFATGDQEARIEAAVFYLLAPEVCLRRWVLGEAPEAISARFSTPLAPAEQVLLDADIRLTP